MEKEVRELVAFLEEEYENKKVACNTLRGEDYPSGTTRIYGEYVQALNVVTSVPFIALKRALGKQEPEEKTPTLAGVMRNREEAYNIRGEHVGFIYEKNGKRYFEDLEESPSREQIARQLENFLPSGEATIEYKIDSASMRQYKETIKLAIEELRKND